MPTQDTVLFDQVGHGVLLSLVEPAGQRGENHPEEDRVEHGGENLYHRPDLASADLGPMRHFTGIRYREKCDDQQKQQPRRHARVHANLFSSDCSQSTARLWALTVVRSHSSAERRAFASGGPQANRRSLLPW